MIFDAVLQVPLQDGRPALIAHRACQRNGLEQHEHAPGQVCVAVVIQADVLSQRTPRKGDAEHVLCARGLAVIVES